MQYGIYSELWFGDCPELEEIICEKHKLTILEINGCKALKYLVCIGNQLNSSALNAIFNSLPKSTDGRILVFGNPGSSECDKSIATNKGWAVDSY